VVDDELFPATDPPAPKPNGGDPPKEPVAAVVTQEALDQFESRTTEQMGQFAQVLKGVQSTQSEITDALGRLGVGGEPTGGDDPLDPASFLTDPTGAMENVATRVMGAALKEHVAPILSMQVETAHNQAVERFQGEVDGTYGAGTWAAEFAPELDPLFEKTRKEAPSRLGDVVAIRKTVDSIKGLKFDRLVELKAKNDAARTEAKETERLQNMEFVRSNLTGGLTRMAGESTLSDEHKEFLGKIMSQTGETINTEEFLASMNSGSSYKEWKAAQPKAKE